ncbi:MAG: iron-containing alcohol dehydrogenase family protein [Clostridia bacterium]|nr:iron-containing alcohol dehydrogenase family protein [Clostridia bacterium]
MNWDYEQPVSIIFGNGRISEISDVVKKVGGSKGLLVLPEYFVKNGTADKIKSLAGDTVAEIFTSVSPNPDVTEVDNCADVIRKNNIDFVIAAGGGSIMDCAKAAATVSTIDDTIRSYHGTGKSLPNTKLPLIAVPTTSGTGSEVTCVAVLTDRENGKKAPIVCDNFFPDYAVIDPELTYSVPQYITASTGLDVLCHAIEGFWSKGHQPICDACAIYSADIVFKYVLKAFYEPDNAEAREKMAEASVIAGLAFTLPKTTSSHACSFPLTNIYHIPHGEACALTLDYFARINKDAENGRTQDFAKKLGFENVDDMADRIVELKKEMGLRCDLKEFNLSDSQIDDLVRISRHPNLLNNPVEITDEILYEMYNSMRGVIL